MNKAQPWNINGVGFDARDAAREAARRQGKSLGEWLHGVIADHADDHDLGPRDVGGQERIDAVTARLEQMGARGGGVDATRRSARPRPDPRQRFRLSTEESDHDEADEFDGARSQRGFRPDDRRARPATPPREDGDDLLEAAIAAMERRATRTEQRTGQALASMARLLEDTQARREQEFGDVAALTRKLGDLETHLSQRFADGADNPIKGSLARLEARLDAIGKRGAAEAAARRSAVADTVPADPEPIRRLEGKLDTILEAMQPRRISAATQASSAAMAAVQAAPTSGRRSLGDAIADISRRQRVLEEPEEDERVSLSAARPASRRPDAAEALVASLRGEMASLAAKVDDIRRDALLSRETRRAAGDDAIDSLRAELGAMASTLGDLAPRGSINALEASVAALADRIELSRDRGIQETDLRPVEAAVGDLRHSLRQLDPRQAIAGMEEALRQIGDKVDGLSGHDRSGPDRLGIERLQHQMEDLREAMATMAAHPSPVERIEHQVSALTDRVDRALSESARSVPAESDMPHLEHLVRELGLRFEAVQKPGADNAALDSLQRQVELLSERFERSETGLSTLPTLAASMRELFAHLEVTRASVETSAAQAAREVLKIAVDEGRQHRGSAEPAFRSQPSEVDARTSATLDTVQDMLGKVVDRLATMEHEIADVRQRPAVARPEPDGRAARDASMPVAPSARPRIHAKGAEGAPPARSASNGAREIRLGGMEPRLAPSPVKPPRKADASLAGSVDPEPARDDDRRPDFIAAARRAAATAQAEAAAAQRQTPSGKAARAGLLAKSRDYVATHKRPMLMGIAAIMMAVGVIALMGRTGGFGGGVDIAAAPAPPARVAMTAPAAPAKIASTQASDLDSGALTPSALPKTQAPLANPIPGSDPIQTGSIPSLPSFAAGAPPPRPRPSLPTGLVAAAEAGDAAAQYDLATRFADGRFVPRDAKLAASWFEKAADSGSAPAQYRLASLYEKGIGVAVDKAKARSLYTKAAEAGNPRAMHNLAVLLADGDGHPDYTAAVSWFRKAAQYGVHDSQYNLAVLLARGLGASQNLVQSYQWFAVAAAASDADAEKKREEVGQKLSANDLAVAKALAASFQAKTPDQAAVEVAPPPGGWDGASGATRLNSARSKISSL